MMKTLDSKEFARKVMLHRDWVDSEGKTGERLVLNNVRLEGETILNTNLFDASFKGCIFVDCVIADSNLEYIDLSDTLFIRCIVENNNFSEALIDNLEGIELYSVTNIGTFWGKAIYNATEDKVFAGCWKGDLETFLKVGLDRNSKDVVECKKIQKVYEFFNILKEEYYEIGTKKH